MCLCVCVSVRTQQSQVTPTGLPTPPAGRVRCTRRVAHHTSARRQQCQRVPSPLHEALLGAQPRCPLPRRHSGNARLLCWQLLSGDCSGWHSHLCMMADCHLVACGLLQPETIIMKIPRRYLITVEMGKDSPMGRQVRHTTASLPCPCLHAPPHQPLPAIRGETCHR